MRGDAAAQDNFDNQDLLLKAGEDEGGATVMIQYRVIEATTPKDLAIRVQAVLEDRWQLQGGVSVTNLGDDNYSYAQAVFRIRELHSGSGVTDGTSL